MSLKKNGFFPLNPQNEEEKIFVGHPEPCTLYIYVEKMRKELLSFQSPREDDKTGRANLL